MLTVTCTSGTMADPATEAVAAFYHLNRSLSKKPRDNGSDRILEAFMKRARYEEARLRFYDKMSRWVFENGVER